MSNSANLDSADRTVAPKHTRRQFLGLAGTTTLGLALAACAPAAAPSAPTSAAGSQPASGAAPAVVSQEKRQIVVSVWGGAPEESIKKIVQPVFEKKYNATISYDLGSAGARLNKLRAQGANPQINVIFGTTDLFIDPVQQGMFAKVNPANVPNIKDLHPWANPKELDGTAFVYALVGYGLTAVKDKIKQPVKSWKDLWRDEFKGKLAFMNPANTQMPHMVIVAAELFGGSKDNIDPGLKALAELRPVKLIFAYQDYIMLLKPGDVTLATDFDYFGPFLQKEGYNVEWILPEEKTIGVENTVALVKGAPNPELGEGFINLMLDPEIQVAMAKEVFQSPSNMAAKLTPPLSDQMLYGPRLEKVRFFDNKFVAANRAKWLERLNTEVVPQWRIP